VGIAGIIMKAEYDFSSANRGAVLAAKGKTPITIYLDDAILEEFRKRADAAGEGIEALINKSLREYISKI
jgi:uncharacterized protein (DUF4415 family)